MLWLNEGERCVVIKQGRDRCDWQNKAWFLFGWEQGRRKSVHSRVLSRR